jgi:hypothetical protein
VSAARVPLVEVGDIITIPSETDYLVSYAEVTGPLRMRVIHVTGDTDYLHRQMFAQLMGVLLDADDKEGKRVTATVKVAALKENPPERAARRPIEPS